MEEETSSRRTKPCKVILKIPDKLGTSKPQSQPRKIQMVGSVILLAISKVTIWVTAAITIFSTSSFPEEKVPFSGNQAKGIEINQTCHGVVGSFPFENMRSNLG